MGRGTYILLVLVVFMMGCMQKALPEKTCVPNKRIEMSPAMKQVVLRLLWMKIEPEDKVREISSFELTKKGV